MEREKLTGYTDMRAQTTGKCIYILLMGASLLSYIYSLAFALGIDTLPAWLWILRLVSAGMAVWLGKLWKDRGFILLAAYTCLFFLRVFIEDAGAIFSAELSENLLSAIWLFGGCYGLGRILNRNELKKFLFVIAAIWSVAMTFYSCTGIHTAWTDNYIQVQSGYFGYLDNRLNMIYFPTISGAILNFSGLFAMICFFSVRNKAGKVCFLMTTVLLIIAMAFTNTRTAYITFSLGVGYMAFILVYRKSEKGKKRKEWLSWAKGIACMLAVFAVLLFAIMQITPTFNRIKQQRGFLPVAQAEERETTESVVIATRDFTQVDLLTGRPTIWGDVMRHIGKDPMLLLTGESKIQPVRKVELTRWKSTLAHCHNILIQVLLESGIPGVLFVLSFMIYTVVHVFRVARNTSLPLWVSLMPAIIVAIWVGDLVETFSWLRSGQCVMAVSLFIACGIVNQEKRVRLTKSD